MRPWNGEDSAPEGLPIAGTEYMPPEAQKLPILFDNMVKEAFYLTDIYDQAIFVFLTMARSQFFYDVNKRMGRFMMNGLLLNILHSPGLGQ